MTQNRTQFVLRPNQMYPHVELPRSKDSPANLRLGGFVGTHCVYNDVRRHQQGSADQQGLDSELACFFGHKNVATLIRAALLAGTMGKLGLITVRALAEAAE